MKRCESGELRTDREGSPVVVVATMKGEPYGGGKDVYANALPVFGIRAIDAGVHQTPKQLSQAVLDSRADALCICMFASLPSAVMLTSKMPRWLEASVRDRTVRTVLAGYGANEQLSLELGFDAYAGDAAQAARVVRDLCGQSDMEHRERREEPK
jgi:methanogenic corrinoid protein MtbC1